MHKTHMCFLCFPLCLLCFFPISFSSELTDKLPQDLESELERETAWQS
jgi:hypothetical protein